MCHVLLRKYKEARRNDAHWERNQHTLVNFTLYARTRLESQPLPAVVSYADARIG